MAKAASILRIDTPEVRVTEWRFQAGDATGFHRHDFDYVVVPLTSGTLRAVAAAGETTVPLSPGGAYFRKAGVEHDVINAGETPFAFIEIELKDRPG
ncbi:MAG TPA: cupin domain-containing protein [Stellaceae bacterium]|nr:cupin domain-containing protein [Stellaceae bacterium]